MKTITLNGFCGFVIECPRCDGSGVEFLPSASLGDCPLCGGAKTVFIKERDIVKFCPVREMVE